ncbi:MAG TPA: biotin/lipoyl-containing protein, partial [Candidimonas sp.]|nr:biotin/lipoyl-containing protein [Candidimonas sp.]
MSTVELKVPDIGDVAEVAVIEILVAVGDTVQKEQSLITVESDKASMEIPADHAGVVKALLVKLGDKVTEGTVIVQLEAAEEAAAGDKPASPKAESAAGAKAAAPVAPAAAASAVQA